MEIKIKVVSGLGLHKIAHDGGDGTILMHCPFCGSGALVARSDGTTECQSCMTMFTVQVQPQYPMSPQTMGGSPVTPPGMPGNLNDQQEQMGDMEQDSMGDEGMPFGEEPMPGEEEGEDTGGMPFDEDDEGQEAPEEDSAAEGDKDESPFPPKKSFRTHKGAALNEDQYVRHLAIKLSPNVSETLDRIRRERGLG